MLDKLTGVKESEVCKITLPLINILEGFLARRNNTPQMEDIPLILDFLLAEFHLILGTVTNLYIKHAV
jgi:hypothetical protein